MTTPKVFVGACSACGTRYRKDLHLHTSIQMLCDTCRGCVIVTLYEVKGRLGKGRCDARCTSSRTRYCSCQCAGSNHGADHLVQHPDPQLEPSLRAGSASVCLESRPVAGADLTGALTVRPQGKATGGVAHASTGGDSPSSTPTPQSAA